jgi:hypothetical protein
MWRGGMAPIKFPEWTVSVPIRVGTGLGLLVVVLTAVHLFFPDSRDALVFFSVAVTAAAAVGATFYVGYTLRAQLDYEQRNAEEERQREQRRSGEEQRRLNEFLIDRTLTYLGKWNEPTLFYARRAVIEVFDIFQAKKVQGVAEYLANEEKAANIRHILNLFEEIALVVDGKYVYEEQLKVAYRGPLLRTYNAAEAWIRDRRNKNVDPKLWEHVERLYNKWK